LAYRRRTTFGADFPRSEVPRLHIVNATLYQDLTDDGPEGADRKSRNLLRGSSPAAFPRPYCWTQTLNCVPVFPVLRSTFITLCCGATKLT